MIDGFELVVVVLFRHHFAADQSAAHLAVANQWYDPAEHIGHQKKHIGFAPANAFVQCVRSGIDQGRQVADEIGRSFANAGRGDFIEVGLVRSTIAFFDFSKIRFRQDRHIFYPI